MRGVRSSRSTRGAVWAFVSGPGTVRSTSTRGSTVLARASGAARRPRRDRAGGVPREGVRDPSGRSGERRGSRWDHVRRVGHRLGRDERALRLQDPVPTRSFAGRLTSSRPPNVTVAGHINEGKRPVRRGLPDAGDRGGRHRGDPERRFVQRLDGVGSTVCGPRRHPSSSPTACERAARRRAVVPCASGSPRTSRCSWKLISTPFFESNVWHVRGRDRDLVVDTGNGEIGDLRAELAPFVDDRRVVAVATHDHFDHTGGSARLRRTLVSRGRCRRDSVCPTGSLNSGVRTSVRVWRTRSAGSAMSPLSW